MRLYKRSTGGLTSFIYATDNDILDEAAAIEASATILAFASDVYASLTNLSKEWHALDQTGARWAAGYPFDCSLEDLCARMAGWLEILGGNAQ